MNAHYYHCSLSFALILLSLSTFSVNATTQPKGFSIDLIHRDYSPLSPFYNSSMTHSERAQNAALRSLARANRFYRSTVETDLVPNDGDYLMKILIGTPPVERWAEADTGSDLIWFQCAPCTKCNPQNAPLFDPKSSSTYMSLSCNSDSCKALPQLSDEEDQTTYPKCGTSNECTYYYSYGDHSYTKGELATESISFGTSTSNNSSQQAVSFPNTTFGCGHNNNATTGGSDTGLVGLGQGSLSLVSQMGNVGRKFSYCLPPYGQQTTTKLRFGEEATISGNGVVSTPLITNRKNPTFYYLTLEGIKVGQRTVPLTSQRNGNIIIDSGTTLTLLPSKFYEQVEDLVKQAIGADQLIVQMNPYKLCYANANSIQNNFPNFEVQFKGARLSLEPQNFFLLFNNNVMCLAMLPTNGLSVYGNVAQIDFEVQHDLVKKKVSFAPVDCTNKQ